MIVYAAHMRRATLLLLTCLLLTACGQQSAGVSDVPGIAAELVAQNPSPSFPERPSYILFDEGLIGRGEPIALFFADPSDAFSQRTDSAIRTLYASGSAIVSTMRVAFATATGARFTYGVLVPDSLVFLRGDGERIENLVHPEPGDVQRILATRP